MPKCFNLPRYVAENWPDYAPDSEVGNNFVWISIGDPEPNFVFTPCYLDSVPNLKLSFLDWPESLDGMETMSMRDAYDIVDFILKYPDKNLLVNCAAGVSRSGSICQYCQDFLGYEWSGHCKEFALPRPEFIERMAYQYNRYFKRKEFDRPSKSV